jgi:transcriptional regulator with PAS, ATPase and Fis domain
LCQVDCGGLPDTLFESELFGYKRGAFTGAVADKTGLFEEAQGGSLLLDEIANTPYSVQGKLLHAIEEKKIRRLGETVERKIDVRLLCATNSDIAHMLQQKSFREDLYYRLSILDIHMPPLRERIVDIPILADYFLKKYALDLKRDIKGFDAKAIKTMISYSWPGNVRELQNTIERAVILAKDSNILTEDLKLGFGSRLLFSNAERTLNPINIVSALKLSKNNISFAAKILGITRPTMYKYMKKHNIHTS